MILIKIKQFAAVAGVCLLAIALLVMSHSNPKPKMINWNSYSTSEILKDLDDEKVILVSVMGSWSLTTVFHQELYSRDPTVLKLVRENPVACYQVDLAKIPEDQISY